MFRNESHPIFGHISLNPPRRLALTITQDLGMEKDGEQLPGVSVFTRGSDGKLRHFYTGGAIMGEEQYRGMDLLSPLRHYFDLLSIGRGDWNPKHAY